MWTLGSPHDSGDMTTHATTQPEMIDTPTTGTSSLRRAGGIAALVKAATYIVGFGVMGAYLAPRGLLDAQGDPSASLSFLLDNQAAMYSWYLVLYLVGGIALVSLVLGVHDVLRRKAPTLSLTAGVFGTIWAGLLLASGLISLVGQQAVVELATSDIVMAESTWSSVSVIQDALGGGIEIVARFGSSWWASRGSAPAFSVAGCALWASQPASSAHGPCFRRWPTPQLGCSGSPSSSGSCGPEWSSCADNGADHSSKGPGRDTGRAPSARAEPVGARPRAAVGGAATSPLVAQ